MLRLALTGDVMLGRNVGGPIEREPPAYVWGNVLPRMLQADLRFVNLECVVSACGEPVQPKVFHFRAPPRTIEVLRAARIDVVSLANNHVLDFGENALLEMLDRLDQAGIARAGAGRDSDEAWSVAHSDSQGLRLGVLAFTDNEPGWEARAGRPGVAYAPTDPESPRLDELLSRVTQAAADVDALVVSAHWGPNMRREPPPHFRLIARAVLDAGARVFWGHSAHIFQGIERRGDGIVLYDTGDFVDDYAVDERERNDLGFLFELELDAAGSVGEVALTPTAVDARACRVDLATGANAEWACERMASLCDAFGTRVERTVDGLRVPTPAARALRA